MFTALLPAQGRAEPTADRDLLDQLNNAAEFSARQLLNVVSRADAGTEYPSSTEEDGQWQLGRGSWMRGFFPGSLWRAYELTGNDALLAPAEQWTAGMDGYQHVISTHDVGFHMLCSYGQGLRVTQRAEYAPPLHTGAQSLATRYAPEVGCTQSWGYPGYGDVPVIIDNMMNIELLLWSAANGGPGELAEMALSHALRTAEEHVRPDGSTYHVVLYDRDTGEVVGKYTRQGLDDDSTWARGQAWGLNGFTTAFRYTRDERLLATAVRLADFFVTNLPEDGVPYWDFDAEGVPGVPQSRDTSAASIAAAGLLELAKYAEPAKSREYFHAAEAILESLATPGGEGGYLAIGSAGRPRAESILLEGYYGWPAGTIWGDYYFLEAIQRYEAYEVPEPASAAFVAGGGAVVLVGRHRLAG